MRQPETEAHEETQEHPKWALEVQTEGLDVDSEGAALEEEYKEEEK